MKTLFLGLFLSLAMTLPQAQAQSLCADLFSSQEVFSSEHLEQVQVRQSSLGHEFLLIQRKTTTRKRLLRQPITEFAEWSDFRNTSERPGDIRWGAEFLLPHLKEILGLKAFDKTGAVSSPMAAETMYIQLPTVQTVKTVFAQLEQGMQARDPHYQILNFYETPAGAISGRTYLLNFAQKSQLPFSTQGHLYEHDLNFHAYSSLIIPTYVSSALRLRAEAFLDLVNYLGQRASSSKIDTELKTAIEKYVFRNFVERIDSTTGNLFASLMLLKNESIGTIMNEVDVFLQISFAGQTSPQKYINTLLARPRPHCDQVQTRL